MRGKRILFLLLPALPCAVSLLACAGPGHGARDAAPADSLAIAYVSGRMHRFPDYAAYRESDDMATEIAGLDLALRQCDFAVEPVGPENFPALLRLAADTAPLPSDLRALRYGPRRLLLVMEAPVEGDGLPSASTKSADIAHNILEVTSAVGGVLGGVDAHMPRMRHTVESGHGFRAILYDKAQDKILLDTLSTVLTRARRIPCREEGESLSECHYRLFVQAHVKGR